MEIMEGNMDDLWSMVGPNKFLKRILDYARVHPITLLQVPSPVTIEIVNHLKKFNSININGSILELNLGYFSTKSPLRVLLSNSTANFLHTVSINQFMHQHIHKERVYYILHGLSVENWYDWISFFGQYSRLVSQYEEFPRFIVFLPHGIKLYFSNKNFGSTQILRWENVIKKSELSTFVENEFGVADTLIERFARATSIEIAGCDVDLLKMLLSYRLEVQINPIKKLLEDIIPDNVFNLQKPISWENGLVESWSGKMRVNSRVLILKKKLIPIQRRIWLAQLPLAMEIAELVGHSLIQKHFITISKFFSKKKKFRPHDKKGIILTNPFEMELQNIITMNEREYKDCQFLFGSDLLIANLALKMRNSVSHLSTIDYQILKDFWDLWSESSLKKFSCEIVGCDWPRIGQKLLMMIGPSYAGKTRWAKKQKMMKVSYDETVKKFNDTNIDIAMTEYVTEFVNLFSNGNDVLLDYSHLENEIRSYLRSLVPEDMPIEYLVFNRTLEKKLKSVEWLNDSDLCVRICDQDSEFNAIKEEIENGDDDSRVSVRKIFIN